MWKHLLCGSLINCLLFAFINGNPVPEDDQPNMPENDSENEDITYVGTNYSDPRKYLVIDDMIIQKDQNRAGLVNNAWPFGVVPYSISVNMQPPQRVMISQAITEITSKTCIQFRPVRNEDSYSLLIQHDPTNQGCSSFVGWQNRKNQPVQISHLCSRGNVVHELIHALGFFHEQTRNDRDTFVKVNYENIQAGYENNFKKEKDMDPAPETTFYGTPYNYDSIMHYGKNYFSKNKEATIEPLNNTEALGQGGNIGQREQMSSGDIQMINNKYCPGVGTGSPESESEITSSTPSSEYATTTKPGSNPMCQYQPTVPGCQKNLNETSSSLPTKP